MVGDVVVEVTITKINDHTRVDAGYVEHVGDVVVQINVCDLTTRYPPSHQLQVSKHLRP